MTGWTKIDLSEKGMLVKNKKACGKPEPPQVGLEDPNPYKNVTNIDKH